MQWKTEHYKLVVTPRYVRLNNYGEKIACHRCNGTGRGCENWEHLGFGDKGYSCGRCMGNGEIEVLPNIPDPPEISKKFLEDLQNWINNYENPPNWKLLLLGVYSKVMAWWRSVYYLQRAGAKRQ